MGSAQRLRAAREAAGLSLSQLAQRTGVHKQQIGDWERGKRPLTLERLWNLALAIGCDPHGLDDRLTSRTKT